jgi:Bacteriophage HK97-gp10, putative tail-component
VSDKTRIEVKGYDELAAGSRELFKRVDEHAKREFQRIADESANRVRSRVPRRSGRLASSVGAGLRDGAAFVQMGEGVPYASYVEYGGRGHPHSPQGNYLYPSAMQAEPELIRAALAAAESEIGGMRWPSPS